MTLLWRFQISKLPYLLLLSMRRGSFLGGHINIFVETIIIPPQVSVCIPVLRLSRHRKKVLFYCHFPDQLLTQRKSALKKLYRAPIDWLEERTTGMADMVRNQQVVMV